MRKNKFNSLREKIARAEPMDLSDAAKAVFHAHAEAALLAGSLSLLAGALEACKIVPHAPDPKNDSLFLTAAQKRDLKVFEALLDFSETLPWGAAGKATPLEIELQLLTEKGILGIDPRENAPAPAKTGPILAALACDWPEGFEACLRRPWVRQTVENQRKNLLETKTGWHKTSAREPFLWAFGADAPLCAAKALETDWAAEPWRGHGCECLTDAQGLMWDSGMFKSWQLRGYSQSFLKDYPPGTQEKLKYDAQLLMIEAGFEDPKWLEAAEKSLNILGPTYGGPCGGLPIGWRAAALWADLNFSGAARSFDFVIRLPGLRARDAIGRSLGEAIDSAMANWRITFSGSGAAGAWAEALSIAGASNGPSAGRQASPGL